MTVRIAINGFGRIGRLVARALLERPDSGLELVAINDRADAATCAALLKRDSVHGAFPGVISSDGNDLVVDGRSIAVTQIMEPAQLPHADMGVELVLECTGVFADGLKAVGHIEAGAKRVLISAPAKNVDITVVQGVNQNALSADHAIVSNASCTTNCLAPIAQIMEDALGIESGHMTTVHSYTNDQALQDQYHSDLRRARAGGLSMIPTTTGATKAVIEVIPALEGRLSGSSIRVPTPNVSLMDFTFTPKRETSREEVNAILADAADSDDFHGVVEFSDEPLVSVDLNHSTPSATLDSLETTVVGSNLVRVLAWYDNEWGFSNRMVDTAVQMAKQIEQP